MLWPVGDAPLVQSDRSARVRDDRESFEIQTPPRDDGLTANKPTTHELTTFGLSVRKRTPPTGLMSCLVGPRPLILIAVPSDHPSWLVIQFVQELSLNPT